MKIYRYYIKMGWFGERGRRYIPRWKYYYYKWFTNIAVWKVQNENL